MRWEQPIQYASRSDIGFRRKNNQDSFAVEVCSTPESFQSHGHLFLVADGMGGHAVGELASKIAADTIPLNYLKSRDPDVAAALKQAVAVANASIFDRGSQNIDFQRMGTTCSALALTAKGAVIAHVGDSRVYRVRNSRIDQLTFDHSLQWELIRQGHMKPDDVFLHEPRHVITRSLGPEEHVDIDVEGPYGVFPGDVYVLCSDGLTNHVGDQEIGMIAGSLPPGEASRLLVNLSNLRGGSDNVTVVIARVGELPAGIPDDRPHHEHPGVPLSWPWLAGFWAAAIAFVGGISLSILGRLLAGAIVGSLGGGALLAMTMAWTRTKAALQPVSDGDQTTILWRPYATADARLSKKFLNHLAALESELQRTASEEKWAIDWKVHEKEFEEAKRALTGNQRSTAFRALARAIDVLMMGLHEQRRQVVHDRRWGRVSSPESEE